MTDCGIYEIKQDDAGFYHVREQLEGSTRRFRCADDVGAWITEELEQLANEDDDDEA